MSKVSTEVAQNAAADLDRLPRETIGLRGSQSSVKTYLIRDSAKVEF